LLPALAKLARFDKKTYFALIAKEAFIRASNSINNMFFKLHILKHFIYAHILVQLTMLFV